MPTPKPRWFHPTLARFFIGLLAVQVLLFVSDQFNWFPFNEEKGWTVLIAVGVVGLAVLAMLVWALVCLVLRRRFQFGVRSLLLFLVAISIPLGWFAWEMEEARRQREAVEAIGEAGGIVNYNYQYISDQFGGLQSTQPAWLRKLLGDDFCYEVVAVDCSARDFDDNDARHLRALTKLERLLLGDTLITDKGLADLKGIIDLKRLSLENTQITGNGLAHLRGMTKLESLKLGGTQVTDAGLAHLRVLTKLVELSLENTQTTDNGLGHFKGMTDIVELSLHNTQITDAGLAHLKAMTKLQSLGLGGTQVTDAGLADLTGTTDLKRLGLDGTQITDKGLVHLKGMTGLETLYIGGSRITDEGRKELRSALPKCDILTVSF
jgi:hypothetical protein